MSKDCPFRIETTITTTEAINIRYVAITIGLASAIRIRIAALPIAKAPIDKNPIILKSDSLDFNFLLIKKAPKIETLYFYSILMRNLLLILPLLS